DLKIGDHYVDRNGRITTAERPKVKAIAEKYKDRPGLEPERWLQTPRECHSAVSKSESWVSSLPRRILEIFFDPWNQYELDRCFAEAVKENRDLGSRYGASVLELKFV